MLHKNKKEQYHHLSEKYEHKQNKQKLFTHHRFINGEQYKYRKFESNREYGEKTRRAGRERVLGRCY
eukprot:6173972-Amphidinium_carterae.1